MRLERGERQKNCTWELKRLNNAHKEETFIKDFVAKDFT